MFCRIGSGRKDDRDLQVKRGGGEVELKTILLGGSRWRSIERGGGGPGVGGACLVGNESCEPGLEAVKLQGFSSYHIFRKMIPLRNCPKEKIFCCYIHRVLHVGMS